MIRGKRHVRLMRGWTFDDGSVRSRLAFEHGRRFRHRHGPAPRFVTAWNGRSPYVKELYLLTRNGLRRRLWVVANQNWRVAWEIGWLYEHDRLARRASLWQGPHFKRHS
jgi:hypothetical protein